MSNKLTKKDYLSISILMTVFAILVFFRIGNTYAPQSYYTTTADNPDIVLDLGDYADIDSISIFLGNLNTRNFSISTYNEVTGAWIVFNKNAVAESVFAWNKIDLPYRLRYIRLLSLDEEAVLNELVIAAPDGSTLLPLNCEKYPELFDEQEMFPESKTYQNGTMFDEVYHGRTAYEFLHGLVTYETTHPHLGKILISLGILIFGMTPFGWRFMSAIFGILMIPVIYVFAKKLFRNTYIATATTALLVFDCMHYSLSRIATIDIFAGFFILLMYYFMYQYLQKKSYLPLALCGISMGLGIASKWTGIYAGLGLGILFLWHNITHFRKKHALRLLGFCCLFFIVLPLIIYTLCFIPVVGYSEYSGLMDKAISGSKYMFDYHANLVSRHYYASPFYEWPVIWMPLLYANDAVSATHVSAASYMGNPAIWWVGIPCVLYVFYRFLIKKDKTAGFLCIAYLAQYVPWIFISRITFIYHYFPAILFVILMMGYTMMHIKERFPWGKKAITIYLVIAVLCFFLFFPLISGLPIYQPLGLRLRWLPDWILVL